MDQKISQHVDQQQELAVGWPPTPPRPGEQCPEASQTASSAFAAPDSGEVRSSGFRQSIAPLKERDYIGLAEAASALPTDETPEVAGVELPEPDLRLGLGLPSLDSGGRASDLKERFLLASSSQQGTAMKTLVEITSVGHSNALPSPAQVGASKNSSKRPYANAMADAPREMATAKNLHSAIGRFNTADSKPSASSLLSKAQCQEAEIKPFLHSARTSNPIGSWQCHNDRHVSLIQAKPRLKAAPLFDAGKGEGGEGLHYPNFDLKPRSNVAKPHTLGSQDDVCDEAPPAKGQVVGWPPVRAYRRSAFAACPKPAGDEGAGSQSTMFVKVNMDGIPIGRKVDLSAYGTYDGLLSALEDMFWNPTNGYGGQFLKGADFVLTYEDKEGDWMLVGDVPWELFVTVVRRLRITRGSEMSGLGLQTSACHA